MSLWIRLCNHTYIHTSMCQNCHLNASVVTHALVTQDYQQLDQATENLSVLLLCQHGQQLHP